MSKRKLIFISTIGIILFLLLIKGLELERSYFVRNYNPILQQTSLNSQIRLILYDHGYTFIRMTDGKKYRAKALFHGIHKDVEFAYFIKTYDLLIKSAGSDTLFVIRGNEKNIFIYSSTPPLLPDELDYKSQ